MVDISVLNSQFEQAEKLKSPVSLNVEDIKVPLVHQAVKATLAGRRQGNACTKNRSKVRGGGAKPFKQKGTGRARQGSRRSPLLVGGGVIFGPTPRDFEQKFNKKMVLKAIQSVLADKFQAGKLIVLTELQSDGKTKGMYRLLNERKLFPALVVVADRECPALRAIRNIEHCKGLVVEGFSVYEAVRHENLIIEKPALESLFERLAL